jgi:diamine N-acetyltransferase
MPSVQLREIVTDAERAAALAIRRGPGQDGFVASVEKSFQDAIADARACPRYWTVNDSASGDVVGFVMISDYIPDEVLGREPEIIGPYFLWRLLIDERHQRRGYGTATLDAVIEYVRSRPRADALYTSCGQGEGSPCPFYERYGFTRDGRIVDEEIVMRLDLHPQPVSTQEAHP